MPDFSKFKGQQGLKRALASAGGGGSFTHTIAWSKEDPPTKYIQFLAESDDLITLPMHTFMRTGKRDNGNWIYSDFIVVPDDDGNAPYDPIHDRFGYSPSQKGIMVAIEMEPIHEKVGGKTRIAGFKPKMREWENKDGEKQEAPAIGLVVQSPFNFWKQLATVEEQAGPIEESVFSVTKTGKGTDTDYVFLPLGEALTHDELGIGEEDFIKLDEWLEERADEERMKRLIDPLPDDWSISQFPPKGKKGKDKDGDDKKKSSSRSSSRFAPTEEADEDAGGEEPEAEAPAPKAAARKSRFSNLKEEMTA